MSFQREWKKLDEDFERDTKLAKKIALYGCLFRLVYLVVITALVIFAAWKILVHFGVL